MTSLVKILGLGLMGLLLAACQTEDTPVTDAETTTAEAEPSASTNSTATDAPYQIEAMPIPDQLDFAGEPVPIDRQDIIERFDRELLVNAYWQSQTVLFHKRANRWFPVIEPILAEHNIPDDFKYLALIESGFMQVRSGRGAAGFWQFVTATAESHGLEVSDEVDERYHVEKATHAACDYLQASYDKFGNWTSAAASYNMGRGGLNNQMTRQQTQDYYDLYLNTETSRYIFRVLAVKTILNNSETYGFFLEEEDLYPPLEYSEVKVDTTIQNLAEWSLLQGSSYREVKELNPWLRKNQLTINNGRQYMIKLPR